MADGGRPDEARFDQYSRYRQVAEILASLPGGEGGSVLDAGSGRERLLPRLLPRREVTCLDPVLAGAEGRERGVIPSTFAEAELEEGSFDFLTAVDLLEHLPPAERMPFIERAGEVARRGLVLTCPCADAGEAVATDRAVDDFFLEVAGRHCPALADHFLFGLPRAEEIREKCRALGWQVHQAGNGHAPWLRELWGPILHLRELDPYREGVARINRQFNREFQPHDGAAPAYRQVFLLTREPLPPGALPARPAGLPPAVQERWTAFRASFTAVVLAGVSRHERCCRAEIDRLEGELEETRDRHRQLKEWATWIQNRFGPFENAFPGRCLEALHTVRSRGLVPTARILAGRLTPAWLRTRVRRWANHRCEAELERSLARHRGRVVVTFPIISWKLRWQRPQQILSRLARKGYTVVYVALELQARGRRYGGREEAARDLSLARLEPDIFELWLHSETPCDIYQHALEGGDLENAHLGLAAFLARWRIADPLCLVQFPSWTPLAQRIAPEFGGRIIFDCMDNHSGFSNTTPSALQEEKDLITRADLVLTSAQVLCDRAARVNRNTILLNNGTEFDHFHRPEPNGELDHLEGGPVIGYFGAISDWFDIDLVTWCARARKAWHFVLIGCTYGCDTGRAEKLENVHFLGEKPYAELPGYLAYFDVCTIPFRITPLTEATNPVKFYEYMSSGKPVVATPLPELLPYRDYCYLAEGPADFLAKLELALAEQGDRGFAEKRIALARENSWDARVDMLLANRVFKQAGA